MREKKIKTHKRKTRNQRILRSAKKQKQSNEYQKQKEKNKAKTG